MGKAIDCPLFNNESKCIYFLILVFLLIILLRSLLLHSITSFQARPLLEDMNFPQLIDDKILDSTEDHVFQLYLMVNLVDRCLKKDPSERETMQGVSIYNPVCIFLFFYGKHSHSLNYSLGYPISTHKKFAYDVYCLLHVGDGFH